MPLDLEMPIVQETEPGVFVCRLLDGAIELFEPFDAKGQTITLDDLSSMTENHAAELGIYQAVLFTLPPGQVGNGEFTYAWGDPTKLYLVPDSDGVTVPEDASKVYQHDTTTPIPCQFIAKSTYLSRLSPTDIEALDMILTTPEKPAGLDSVFTQADFAEWRRNYLDYPAFDRTNRVGWSVTKLTTNDPDRVEGIMNPDWSLAWNYSPFSPPA